jgi:hypothetical protein
MQLESHPNVVGATKARHKSCSKLDATSISRNCIDCFEQPTCQCMDLHFMHRFSDHKLRHLIDTVRLLADTPAYCGPRRRKVACACSRPWGDRTQEPDLELASKVPSRRISNRQIYTYPIKFQSTPLCTDRQTVPSTLLQSHQIALPRPEDHDVLDFNHLSLAAGASRLRTPACHARYVHDTLARIIPHNTCDDLDVRAYVQRTPN